VRSTKITIDENVVLQQLEQIENLHYYRLRPSEVYEWSNAIYLYGLQSNKNDLVVRSSLPLAQANLDRADYRGARELLEPAVAHFRTENLHHSEAIAHRYLGILEGICQNNQAAEHHLLRTLELARKEKNRGLEAHTLLDLSNLALRFYGPSKALYYCERTIDLSSSVDLHVLRFALDILKEIGRQLDRNDLLKFSEGELNLLLKQDDRSKEIPVWDLALAADQSKLRGEFAEALHLQERAEKMLLENQIPVTYAETIVEQGMLLLLIGREEEAFQRIKKGLLLIRRTKNERGIQHTLFQYAKAYHIVGDNKKCLTILDALSSQLEKRRNIGLTIDFLELKLASLEQLHRYKEAVAVSKMLMTERVKMYSVGSYQKEYVGRVVAEYQSSINSIRNNLSQAEQQLQTTARRVLQTPDLEQEQRAYLKRVLKEEGLYDTAFNQSAISKPGIEITAKVAALRDRFPTLSKMELKVCGLLLASYTTTQIALELSLSDRTIDAHRRSIRKKLFIKSKEDLAKKLLEVSAGNGGVIQK